MISKGFISLVQRMRQAQRNYYAGEGDIKAARALENRVDDVLAKSQHANLFVEKDEPEPDENDSMTRLSKLVREHGLEEGRRLWREGK